MLDVAGVAEIRRAGEWNMAKLPFAQALVPLYADYVCRTISAMRGKKRRCLVLDLDNNYGAGIIGDDGLDGIHLAQGDAAVKHTLIFNVIC